MIAILAVLPRYIRASPGATSVITIGEGELMSAESTNRLDVATIETQARGARSEQTRRVKVGRWFYIGTALFMIVLSAAGFGPSFIEEGKRTAPPTPLVIAHGFVAAMWLLLFLVQVTLVANRRTAVHRRVGKIGPVVAALMIVLGYLTIIEFARRGYDLSGDLQRAPLPPGIPPPTPEEFVAAILAPFLGFANFAILIGLGLWFRNRPEVHKRLMLLASVSLALTPLIHLSGNLVGRWPSLSAGLSMAVPVTYILVLFVGAAHDKLSRGRIHPISLWIPALIIVELFGLNPVVMKSAMWSDFAERLVTK
jgi:uncharacterized membrane protein YozB (DUF420 family)